MMIVVNFFVIFKFFKINDYLIENKKLINFKLVKTYKWPSVYFLTSWHWKLRCIKNKQKMLTGSASDCM